MKKLIFIFLMLLLAFSVNAQVKFMGIPVDGSKSKMISKLKQKGFEYNKDLDCLTGEFDGEDVMLSLVTTKNKVSSICVFFGSYFGEYTISGYGKRVAKNKFNDLIYSFDNNNTKYVNLSSVINPGAWSSTIDDDEDIEYQIKHNNKEYHAYYIQLGDEKTNAVHFAITEASKSGEFWVILRYDNLDNRSQGEDL